MEPYYLSPPGDKYLVIITDARHGDFGGDVADSDAAVYVKAASAAFWDYCINARQFGRQWLEGADGFRRFAGDRATLQNR